MDDIFVKGTKERVTGRNFMYVILDYVLLTILTFFFISLRFKNSKIIQIMSCSFSGMWGSNYVK